MGCLPRQPFLALALGLLGANAINSHASACSLQALAKRPLKIPFCELIKTPAKYSGHDIETSGIYHSGFEVVTFSNPECSSAPATWAEIKDPRLRTSFDRASFDSDGLAFRATVIGRFTHATDTPVSTKEGTFLPPAFGFLGQFRNLIAIDCFSFIQPIKPLP